MAQVEPLFSDQPLWVRDIADALQQDEEQIRGLLLTAARLGHITAIVRDRYYRSAQIQIFADLIRQRAAAGGSTAADFRNQLGTGRKVAVQILEFFDRSGFTLRRGNDHCCATRACSPFCRVKQKGRLLVPSVHFCPSLTAAAKCPPPAGTARAVAPAASGD